ncbi:MAG: DUF72 domain-containing protein [Thermoanaerobaculia bacterium]
MANEQLPLFPAAPSRKEGLGLAAIPDSLQSIASRIPRSIRLGTSSWSFPGWRGIVWDRPTNVRFLSRQGLAVYSRHPLLRAVGVDRTYYTPVSADVLAGYASQVPGDFRFLVKAARACTSPELRTGTDGPPAPNPHFLDPGWAIEHVVTPFMEGVGDRGGPLVFQFPPLGSHFTRDPARFIAHIAAFLSALPKGPWYAVEIRDPELLTSDYAGALSVAGASHCVNVHPRMPPVGEQAEIASEAVADRLVIRWMLHGGMMYEEAKERYAPFDHLVDEDSDTRDAVARLATTAVTRGGEVMIVANNKAEGSAPLTLFKLAEQIVG